MNTQNLRSVIVSFEHKISVSKHPERLTKPIWCSTQQISVKLMLSKTKSEHSTFVFANPEKIQKT